MKSDFAVSANMAYGQVTLGALGDAGGEYEDPDKLARSGRGGGGGGGGGAQHVGSQAGAHIDGHPYPQGLASRFSLSSERR